METPMIRAEQARVEAERRYPESWDHYNDEPVDDWGYSECQREAFCAGVVWADANPKPRAITRAQREVLLTDGAVERAARALVWETTGGGYVKANDRDRGIARRILTAAIRGENDD